MRGYSHLSDDEGEQIGLLTVLGHSIGAIARAIGRPKSTISRELKPLRGAPKARDLTAKARTELSSIRRKTNSRQ